MYPYWPCKCIAVARAVARPIIVGGGGGRGGTYSYIRVLSDGFLLKAIVFTVCEHEYMNIHPPPIIAFSYGPGCCGNNVSWFVSTLQFFTLKQ
jgi:hypothetical protein